MNFKSTLSNVGGKNGVQLRNKKRLPEFLEFLISWAKDAPEEVFAVRMDDPGETDVYTSVRPVLGPWTSLLHRRAVMCEVLRVLGGFESSWDFSEGVDVTNNRSMSDVRAQETGVFQVSFDSLGFGADLKALAQRYCHPLSPVVFIEKMKESRPFAFEYAARLLRHTIRHNGPVKRREIHAFLSRDAVTEFQSFLA